MADAELLVQVRSLLLLLWMRVFLFQSGWTQVGHCHNQNSPEVVIPVKVTRSGRDARSSSWLSYSMHFGGQRHIVHLKTNKLFLARHIPVFTYTEQGALLEDHPFFQDDCFYHGYVEGDPESQVALSTCFGGFQGTLMTNDITYGIKPKLLSTTFEHLVYRRESDESFTLTDCGMTDKEITAQLKLVKRRITPEMRVRYLDWWIHTFYIEVGVVVDRQRFLHSNRNITLVFNDICLVMNQVGLLLKALALQVALMGVEVWSQKNLIPIHDVNDTLKIFCIWKQSAWVNRLPHDIAHLFVKKNFSRALGASYWESACDPSQSCAVEPFLEDNIEAFSYKVTHQIGHNVGMVHDSIKNCTCGEDHCIMFYEYKPSRKFSNCSFNEFWEFAYTQTCLYSLSAPNKMFKHIRCGNGVAEEGEECDCGTMELCSEDLCCNSNCTLIPGASCAFGLCCETCGLMGPGEVCRKVENECDLPEWCNGTSHHCPEDVYIQDGFPCSNGYCYEKRCNGRDDQCRKIFGPQAKSANMKCYKEINSQGDRFGHCGIIDTQYIKCNGSQRLCGRIQCDNVKKLPLLIDHTTVHFTNFQNIHCWGTDYHIGMSIPDIGAVTDGTLCGLDQICIQRKCVDISVLDLTTCTAEICTNNGICNNKHNCHCDYGFSPPFCSEPGYGGSIDSGPAPEKQEFLKDMGLDYLLINWLFRILALLFCACCLIIIGPFEDEDE
ncbi:disintegrin and metalloproteinase domain-containing protein 21-like [Sorex fumeus]|uniref:disintegrin and metalloproteinase domain-containing protein 21-like n=1 Tax=Sorex fumeus TaxID=62283 RepID=UPI0024AC9224|nr:disintegrin and metalloproteinase domain-containing protein 21-like [Sorex fumeus]